MSGNASEPGYVGDALGRHLFPLRYGAPLNAKLGSETGHQAALGAQQVHTDGHQDTLSLTVRQGKPETAAKNRCHPLICSGHLNKHRCMLCACPLPQRSVPPVWPPVSASAVLPRK
jgi:hypothetical protein